MKRSIGPLLLVGLLGLLGVLAVIFSADHLTAGDPGAPMGMAGALPAATWPGSAGVATAPPATAIIPPGTAALLPSTPPPAVAPHPGATPPAGPATGAAPAAAPAAPAIAPFPAAAPAPRQQPVVTVAPAQAPVQSAPPPPPSAAPTAVPAPPAAATAAPVGSPLHLQGHLSGSQPVTITTGGYYRVSWTMSNLRQGTGADGYGITFILNSGRQTTQGSAPANTVSSSSQFDYLPAGSWTLQVNAPTCDWQIDLVWQQAGP